MADAAYNQFAVVPVRATHTIEDYLTRRKQLMDHIEDEDVKQLKSQARGGTRVSTIAASATSSPLPKPPVLRITPPGRWWVLPFGELWEYRELLYFLFGAT